MKKSILCAVCAVLMTCAGGQADEKPAGKKLAVGHSQTTNEDLNLRAYIQLLRSDIRTSKSQIVGQVMQLDADQATKFWPVYKAFETDLTKIGDEIVSLVNRYVAVYNDMQPEVADELATKLLDIEKKRIDLKAEYYTKMKDALDPVTAARFLQVENQLEKLLDLQIAAELPVIQ